MSDIRARAMLWFRAMALVTSAAGVVVAGGVIERPVAEANSGLFNSLGGRWTGSGSIRFSDGEKERLRCRVTYFVSKGSTKLAQNIRCASEGFIIEVKSDLNARGSRISGSWKETTSNIKGSISGRASDDSLRLAIKGKNFSSSMVITSKGRSQSVSISAKGGRVSGISMRLRKS